MCMASISNLESLFHIIQEEKCSWTIKFLVFEKKEKFNALVTVAIMCSCNFTYIIWYTKVDDPVFWNIMEQIGSMRISHFWVIRTNLCEYLFRNFWKVSREIGKSGQHSCSPTYDAVQKWHCALALLIASFFKEKRNLIILNLINFRIV